MKPLNRHHVNFPSKTNYKMIENGKRLENWWEDVGDIGNGKLKQEIQKEIDEAYIDYAEQSEEDRIEYLKLIKEGIYA